MLFKYRPDWPSINLEHVGTAMYLATKSWKCHMRIQQQQPFKIVSTVEPVFCGHLWDTQKVSTIERCPL